MRKPRHKKPPKPSPSIDRLIDVHVGGFRTDVFINGRVERRLTHEDVKKAAGHWLIEWDDWTYQYGLSETQWDDMWNSVMLREANSLETKRGEK